MQSIKFLLEITSYYFFLFVVDETYKSSEAWTIVVVDRVFFVVAIIEYILLKIEQQIEDI